jgi:hypothetical protein
MGKIKVGTLSKKNNRKNSKRSFPDRVNEDCVSECLMMT